jgi:hypothetical protein
MSETSSHHYVQEIVDPNTYFHFSLLKLSEKRVFKLAVNPGIAADVFVPGDFIVSP